MIMRKFFCFLICSILIGTSISVSAQTIKGKVLDASTGEPLVGAIIKLENSKTKTLSRLDGSFSFAKLSGNSFVVLVKFEGYEDTVKQTVTFNGNETKTITFNLKPSSTELTSITLSSDLSKNGENGARRIEKISDPIVNVLSEKAIQLLPDITVANAMQRVSGVSIERSGNGEGRYPIIRGMEKRYINTLVNGIKIPSPDNKNRFIPLDLFPSELLERLEVSKSLIPSMEGDAIGGTINLVMKDAPEKRLLSLNASTGYSDIFNDQDFQHFAHSGINTKSPTQIHGTSYTVTPADFQVGSLNYNTVSKPINSTFGITYGNRFGKTKKFGMIVSGSYQNIFKGTNSTFFLPNGQPGINNIPEFQDLEARTYSSQNTRIGLNAKFDYQINKNNKISLVNTYVRLDDYITRFVSDTIALNSLVDKLYRSTWQYQSIYNTTLQGLHNLTSSLKFDWSLVYSIAENHKPDEAEFTHEYPVAIPADDKVQSLSHTWSYNSDKDIDAYLNLSKVTKVFGKKTEFKLGGVIRDKTRDNLYHSYSLTPVLSSTGANQLYTSINNAVFTFKGTGYSTPDFNNGNTYTFNETISSGYAQGKVQFTDKLEALGGVRVEYTHQHYNTNLDSSLPYIYGSIWYTDVLPSIQFKYKLNKIQSLRFAYYKALARPGFAEMIPDGPGGFETFKPVGNPAKLNHTTADNIDLRYEVFSKKTDQLLIGAFYKNINDPIEYTIDSVRGKATAQNLVPENFGTATNFGFEALYTKYFGAFGISASYTYTESKISTNKKYIYRDTLSGQIKTKSVAETRPLQGQSKHIGNISLMYKNPKIGFDVQVAFIYTGERIAMVSPNLGLDYWQTPTTQLDISFEKRIIKNLSFYGKLNNLTNTPYILELHQSYNNYLHPTATGTSRALPLQTDPANKIIVLKDFYKGTYLFGVRYKF